MQTLSPPSLSPSLSLPPSLPLSTLSPSPSLPLLSPTLSISSLPLPPFPSLSLSPFLPLPPPENHEHFGGADGPHDTMKSSLQALSSSLLSEYRCTPLCPEPLLQVAAPELKGVIETKQDRLPACPSRESKPSASTCAILAKVNTTHLATHHNLCKPAIIIRYYIIYIFL